MHEEFGAEIVFGVDGDAGFCGFEDGLCGWKGGVVC